MAIYLIDVAKNDLLHRGVFEDLAHDAPITTADNEHLFWVWVASEGNMGDHFLVAER